MVWWCGGPVENWPVCGTAWKENGKRAEQLEGFEGRRHSTAHSSRPQPAANSKDVFRPTGRATDEERTKMEGKWDKTARVLWPHELV
jgi:hypothetical protein